MTPKGVGDYLSPFFVALYAVIEAAKLTIAVNRAIPFVINSIIYSPPLYAYSISYSALYVKSFLKYFQKNFIKNKNCTFIVEYGIMQGGDRLIYVTLIYWNGGGCSALYTDFRR